MEEISKKLLKLRFLAHLEGNFIDFFENEKIKISIVYSQIFIIFCDTRKMMTIFESKESQKLNTNLKLDEFTHFTKEEILNSINEIIIEKI